MRLAVSADRKCMISSRDLVDLRKLTVARQTFKPTVLFQPSPRILRTMDLIEDATFRRATQSVHPTHTSTPAARADQPAENIPETNSITTFQPHCVQPGPWNTGHVLDEHFQHASAAEAFADVTLPDPGPPHSGFAADTGAIFPAHAQSDLQPQRQPLSTVDILPVIDMGSLAAHHVSHHIVVQSGPDAGHTSLVPEQQIFKRSRRQVKPTSRCVQCFARRQEVSIPLSCQSLRSDIASANRLRLRPAA